MSGTNLHVAVARSHEVSVKPGSGSNLHVDGEEVDAGVHAVVERVLQEVPRGQPLAHQPAQAVGKTVSTVSISPLRTRLSSDLRRGGPAMGG